MKVLFLTNIPSPYRVEFFNELGKHCELTVWFEARSEANRKWRIEQLGASFRFRFLSGFTLGLDKHVNVSVVAALEREPFDVYVLGGYSSPTEMLAIHWLKLRRKRFILSSDGGFVSADRWAVGKLKRYLISSADLWLSSGTNCTRYLQGYGADPERIVEYPFSSGRLDERELAPLPPEEKEALKRREGLHGAVILSVGQFIPRKGFDVLLDAFGRLSGGGVSLLLIGGGPEREKYERTVRDRGLRHVVIKDFMHKRELLRYWKVADLFALPTREDIWGLVLNEALAFGLPIVATTKAGAAFDLVREGVNGYRVPPDNPAALADRCGRLARQPELRRRFGAESRKLAERYRMERMVEKHVEALERFMSEGGDAGIGGKRRAAPPAAARAQAEDGGAAAAGMSGGVAAIDVTETSGGARKGTGGGVAARDVAEAAGDGNEGGGAPSGGVGTPGGPARSGGAGEPGRAAASGGANG